MVRSSGGPQIDSEVDVVWNGGTPFCNVPGGGGRAGGGGISETVAVPSCQSKAKIPMALANKKIGSGVPDIAMSGTNCFTRVQGQEGPSGGKSTVAPLRARLVGHLNQAKNKSVGFLDPFLYANVSERLVEDVWKGTNAIKGTVKGYQARTGWDACTGPGTPEGAKILNNL
jgi:kumamolisin